ncbi:MAG: hypothetical protein NZ932_05865, partial [Candidatus Bathyarchaeota archaeon]|nr:hypothetical protein [Candidatus Bathyarchaeota archaeon]MDW8023548.1 hypothetical protein [Nitrososphaerota archaeon]
MTTEEKLGFNDILYGVIVPCIVAALIIIFPAYLKPIIADPTLQAIFVDGLGEAILIIAVPLLLGLLWNRWAGGIAGFLLGSIYALYINDMFVQYSTMYPQYQPNDISTLGYVVCAMMTGYLAGALNKGSFSFKRMLIAGLVSGIIGGFFLLWTQIISPLGMVTDVVYAIFITLLPRIIYGLIIPVIAKVFIWYNVLPRRP